MYGVVINKGGNWLSVGRMLAILNEVISESIAWNATLDQRFIVYQGESYAGI